MSRTLEYRVKCCSVSFSALMLFSSLSGCTASQTPCLQFETRSIHKTIFMRGYGSVEVVTDSLVCASRDELYSLS